MTDGLEPIKIVEVIAAKVGTPRNDGSRGSALYDVPLRLSRRPSLEWAEIFVASWDRPPRFTTMHRPGIASVEGDVVWLRGTTLEEVEKVHQDTLRVVLDQTNQEYSTWLQRQRKAQERDVEREAAHRKHVEDVAKRIKFD